MKSNPQKQPDLKPEAEVDMLDAEQTFPTEEEIALEVFPFANKFKISRNLRKSLNPIMLRLKM